MPLRPYPPQLETIEASVGNVKGTFLFDTGEGITAITPQFAQRIGCRPWGRITGFRMTGERLDFPHCDNLVFTAGGIDLAVPAAVTFDIMRFMSPGSPHLDGSIGLDAFAGRAITIVPRGCIIVESPEDLTRRTASARSLPIRLVRDAEGVALTVNAAVRTPDGTAWMELDSGSFGTFVIANHIAPLFGLKTDQKTLVPATLKLANGVIASGPAWTRDLIMDGNIGAQFLNNWDLTLNLADPRAWLLPKTECPSSVP